MERLSYAAEPMLLIYDNALDADSLVNFLPRAGSARVTGYDKRNMAKV